MKGKPLPTFSVKLSGDRARCTVSDVTSRKAICKALSATQLEELSDALIRARAEMLPARRSGMDATTWFAKQWTAGPAAPEFGDACIVIRHPGLGMLTLFLDANGVADLTKTLLAGLPARSE